MRPVQKPRQVAKARFNAFADHQWTNYVKLAYDTTSTFKRPSSVFVQSRVKRFKTGQYDFGVSIGVGLQ